MLVPQRVTAMIDQDFFIRRGKLHRAIDGDTISVDVDMGFNITQRIRFRLYGVDTPERGHPDFESATNYMLDLLDQVVDDQGYFVLKSHKVTGKYGRWLAEIPGVTDKLAEQWRYERK